MLKQQICFDPSSGCRHGAPQDPESREQAIGMVTLLHARALYYEDIGSNRTYSTLLFMDHFREEIGRNFVSQLLADAAHNIVLENYEMATMTAR